MAYIIYVNIPDQPAVPYNLVDGRYRLGSNPECEIHIDHPEVAKISAHVDVRGEAIFLRNLNPFPIFVGQQELSSSQQGEWPIGESVLLTQNITLDLHSPQVQLDSASAAESAKRSRSTLQLAIVGLCLLAGYFLLSGDSAPTDSTKSLDYSFTDLVEQLEQKKSSKYVTVLNYLIDARVSDVRWGEENPSRAVSAYQLLLDEPEIRVADASALTPEGRIRQFALARLDDLSQVLAKQH